MQEYQKLLDINTIITILCDERYLEVNSDAITIFI